MIYKVVKYKFVPVLIARKKTKGNVASSCFGVTASLVNCLRGEVPKQHGAVGLTLALNRFLKFSDMVRDVVLVHIRTPQSFFFGSRARINVDPKSASAESFGSNNGPSYQEFGPTVQQPLKNFVPVPENTLA